MMMMMMRIFAGVPRGREKASNDSEVVEVGYLSALGGYLFGNFRQYIYSSLTRYEVSKKLQFPDCARV